MIPFLKKNKDGRKPPKSTVPRTAQESIPFQRMFEDGTCRVRPGYYTRTIQYQDINYQLAQQEDKTAIFEEYVKWSIADLPILPQKWQYLVSASTKKQFGIMQKLMNRPDVDSIVNSCDAGQCGWVT